MKNIPSILNYHNAATIVACEFMEKYYKGHSDGWYWIADVPAGCLSVGEEYWNMEPMIVALQKSPSRKKLMDWYWYMVETKNAMNLQSYLKLKK